jgi:hypothetical protein
MDPKSQKRSPLFASPFAWWADLTLKLWGIGKPAAETEAPEKAVGVAVIPTRDAAKAVQAASKPKRAKVRGKSKSKAKARHRNR